MLKKSPQNLFVLILLGLLTFQCTQKETFELQPNTRIALIGNNLGSRMMDYGSFETEMQLRNPDKNLFIRNLSDPGDTPGFRPRSGTNDPWVFPGAEDFQEEYATPSGSIGHFEKPDEWLARLQTDIIIAFFGSNESFQGVDGLENYKAELDAFIKHTLRQQYHDTLSPKLAIVSPIAFEDLSEKIDVPDGKTENENINLYTVAMQEVAENNKVLFVDAFTPSKQWYLDTEEDLTIDGSQLNEAGYEKLAVLLADEIFGKQKIQNETNRELVHEAVQEKNWFWRNDYKIPNGVHVFGRRYDPFGPDNYPFELEKIRQMTAIRDTAIWMANKGERKDLAAADAKTKKLPEVETNYNPEKNGSLEYLYGEEALSKLKVAPGYKIELFASEEDWPNLANPVQLSFDNKGRLWVATMPSLSLIHI